VDDDGCHGTMNVELGAVDQARMVTALRRHLGSTAGNVAFFETHLSFVLLADGFAYKLKKAIDLGFADFTARASRRFFCDEELRINRRLAPTLYLDRVEIVGTVETPPAATPGRSASRGRRRCAGPRSRGTHARLRPGAAVGSACRARCVDHRHGGRARA
jgi:hypothetical protein